LIGIVGGTGDFGQGLAARLRALGEDVVIGSRTPREEFVSNTEACERSDVIFLCVPPENAEAMARELAAGLSGHIVVSVASSLRLRDGESLAERTAAVAPGARVVAGFHTVSATLLKDLDQALDEDVLLCGGDEEAKERVAEIAERIVQGQAVDCGNLRTARRLEALTGLLVGINRRYKTNAGVRITGLEGEG
jgi:NADPH-dependent F420 reductase